MRRRILSGLLVLLTAGSAYAGGAGEQRVAGHKDFAAGTLDRLMLDAHGIVRPGFKIDSTALDTPTAWCAVRTGQAVWIGTGNDALLLRDDGAGKITRIETGEGGLMVTALAALPDGGVAAASIQAGACCGCPQPATSSPWPRCRSSSSGRCRPTSAAH